MEYWTYSTEFEQVEEIATLFNTLEEAKQDALKKYLEQGCDEENWRELTQYYKFKVYE